MRVLTCDGCSERIEMSDGGVPHLTVRGPVVRREHPRRGYDAGQLEFHDFFCMLRFAADQMLSQEDIQDINEMIKDAETRKPVDA